MADVITRFKLETTQYDSKLRDASKGLAEFAKRASLAGKDFDKFTKGNAEAARALGSIGTSANNTKDKVRELVGAYNDLARVYNVLTQEQQQSDWARAMAQSLQQLQARIKDAKQEMQGLSAPSGSGLLGGNSMSGMLQVFGGNMMTKAVSLVASGMEQLGEKIVDITQKSIEMSAQAEGIVNAFNRLDKPGLLENLREATHGTVNDLELMKAAVKFNDFNLPVEQLGTMLAFAQQKAKDTGQSVDYMVDSIVTGLGRKSLMILDNLGLSAAQIKERMAETGDMTTAVAEIIRERMSEAGDYVETAADRAAQANAELENSYLELGNQIRETFAFTGMSSVEELKVYMEKELVGSISFTVDWIDHLKDVLSSITDIYDDITAASPFPQMLEDIVALYTPLSAVAMLLDKIRGGDGSTIGDAASIGGVIAPKPKVEGSLSITKENGQIVKVMRDGVDITKEYIKSLDKASQSVATLKKRISETSTIKHGKTETEEQLNNDKIQTLTQEYVNASEERRAAIREEIQGYQKLNEEIRKLKDEALGKVEEVDFDKLFPMKSIANGPSLSIGESMAASITHDLAMGMQQADVTALRSIMQVVIANGLEGIDIPTESLMEQIFGDGADIPDDVWQKFIDQINEKLKEKGIDPIQLDFSTGKTGKKKEEKEEKKYLSEGLSKLGGGLGGLQSGFEQLGIDLGDGFKDVVNGIQGVSTILSAIMTIVSAIEVIAGTDALIPFANGGVVHAANGWSGVVPGTSFSGDNVPILANSGEIVLNASQQSNLAQNLKGSGGGGISLVGVLKGENLALMLDTWGRRTGRGELLFGKNL